MENSRVIKFRAWDKQQKKMLFDTLGGISKDGSIFLGNEGYFKGILMQFTGLKDKNGVEIYEGDIIRSGSLKLNFKIEFGMVSQGFYAVPLNRRKYTSILLGRMAVICYKLEIIGNIYEKKKKHK